MDSRKYLSRIGWAYIAFEAAAMVGILLVSGAAQVMQVLRPDAKLDFNVLTVIGQLAVYALGFPVFYLLMRRIPSWRKKEPQSIKFGTFFVLMIFCFGVTYVADLPRQIIMYGIHLFIEMEEVNPLYEVLGDMKLWMVVVLTVFLAPIMEELMFRKMLVDRLVPFGQKTAVIVSGLSFGLFHGNFHQFFYATALGMVFAYIYSSTGRIRYNILLHMVINIMGGPVLLLLIRGMESEALWAYLGVMVLGLMILASMIASVTIFFLYLRDLTWFPAWKHPQRGFLRTLLRAPGIWAFIAGCMLAFFL